MTITVRTIVLVALLSLVSVGSVLQAAGARGRGQGSRVAVQGFKSGAQQEQAAALHIMRELLQCNQWDRAGEWLTQAYHQHNPNAASGLAGVVDVLHAK
jgi:hypothetical protein